MIKDRDKEILKLFGANLRKYRKLRGISLRELSYSCNIDYSKISKIEKGQINITITTIIELAEALEISPSDLFNFPLS